MVVTFLLVAVNIAVYASGASAYTYGFDPSHPGLLAMISSMFMHDGLAHIAGNMVFLSVFGVLVERHVGSVRFLALYLAAGVGGAMLHAVSSPTELVGASGAIFGVMAVAAVLRPRLLGFVGAYVAINVFWALAGTGGAVSFGAHLGGFAVGVLFVVVARMQGRVLA
jgi:rhomboid protease GluP